MRYQHTPELVGQVAHTQSLAAGRFPSPTNSISSIPNPADWVPGTVWVSPGFQVYGSGQSRYRPVSSGFSSRCSSFKLRGRSHGELSGLAVTEKQIAHTLGITALLGPPSEGGIPVSGTLTGYTGSPMTPDGRLPYHMLLDLCQPSRSRPAAASHIWRTRWRWWDSNPRPKKFRVRLSPPSTPSIPISRPLWEPSIPSVTDRADQHAERNRTPAPSPGASVQNQRFFA